MFGFHGPELIVVLVIALLVFGPKKLPEMGSAIGKSIKEFRKGMNELTHGKEEELKEARAGEDPKAIEREIVSQKSYDGEVVRTGAVETERHVE